MLLSSLFRVLKIPVEIGTELAEKNFSNIYIFERTEWIKLGFYMLGGNRRIRLFVIFGPIED